MKPFPVVYQGGEALVQAETNWIAGFIWGIADDVLRDLYVRGKCRDVILPMTVLRGLDAVLEPTKQAVFDMKARLDREGIVHQDGALRQAAGQAFYNISKFTLRDLRARASQQQLRADFAAYLDGFSRIAFYLAAKQIEVNEGLQVLLVATAAFVSSRHCVSRRRDSGVNIRHSDGT